MTTNGRRNAWLDLSAHYKELGTNNTIASLFEADPQRFQRLSIEHGDILLDYSKNRLTEETLTLLQRLAEESGLPAAIEAMYRGDAINTTERRPALHVALRGEPPDAAPQFSEVVTETLGKMEGFVARVHSGEWKGYSDEPIRTVINIGIGGSDLGPAMVAEALRSWHVPQLTVHFVSNVDPTHMRQTLVNADPATTLFIIASKSFSTLETHQNATLARSWYIAGGGSESRIDRHFVAVSANVPKAVAFGIHPDNIFPLWDWVGGRYSLWSAIGLPIALATGMNSFRELLEGASLIDRHFVSAPLLQNIPVIMGLLAIWHSSIVGATSQVVLPYSQSLHLFPSYLQQLEMESLGKSVTFDGSAVATPTGPVIWGSAGTNGQHSFHQLLHQGTQLIPADFIGIVHSAYPADKDQHLHLLANCFSQSQALMQGKSEDQARRELLEQGLDQQQAAALAPHRVITGNKPSTTILLQRLSARNLGSLIAIYEHKVFVESILWDINAFDQWGVELGKQLGEKLYAALRAPDLCDSLDGSTNGLINHCRT